VVCFKTTWTALTIAFELTAARIEALVHKARESPTPQGMDRLGRM
jgi:hypothetical protein